jgi:ubiquinone/menaquinone biosynthesis C-methylase UbiE
VFNQIELERQAVEMREFLIYHTDPALGAVWSRYEQEFAKLSKKHEEEIKQEALAEKMKKWQRQKRLEKLSDEALIFGVVLLLILEMWALMYAIQQSRDM